MNDHRFHVLTEVSLALLQGLRLQHGRVVAEKVDENYWECRGARGPIEAFQSYEVFYMEYLEVDTSAFAAARTFVSRVSEKDALEAVNKAVREKLNVDPDANWEEQEKLAKHLRRAAEIGEVEVDDVTRLVDLVLELQEWGRRGGFPPSVFKAK